MSSSSKSLDSKILRKQKRGQHLITNETKIVCVDTPGKYLVVCNAGLSTGLQQEHLLCAISSLNCDVTEIIMLPGKSYCFISCPNVQSSENIFKNLHGKVKLGQHNNVLYLSYCTEVPKVENPWHQALPNGLILLKDFITTEEEDSLLKSIAIDDVQEDTENALKHRIVKHFGYEFVYGVNNVDVTKPLEQKIPPVCDKLWDKLRDQKQEFHVPNQLTVNKYEIGQGIPPHVDTHSAFQDPILSLSLCSDVVMEFRNPKTGKHVYVLLPRRSLLIMSKESRYGWTHAITPRKMDIVPNGDAGLSIAKRKMRISLTFRALKSDPCTCEYHYLCDSYKSNEKIQNDNRLPSQLELENVHKVYDEIANHFSETRHSPWPNVEKFVCSFELGQIIVDIGCGNGKYLLLNPSIFKIGCDRSQGLLNVCRERDLNAFKCDCLNVPVKSNSVDGCMSIAVIHHLASKERRLKALQEMARILTNGGRGLIYVWAKNQQLKNKKSSYLRQNKKNNIEPTSSDTAAAVEKDTTEYINGLPVHTNRTQFIEQDMLVPWKLKGDQESNDVFLRFYHVFEENELAEMCSEVEHIKVLNSYYDQGNWCIEFQKIA